MTTATTTTTTTTTNANVNANQPQPADKSSATPSTTPSATATPKPSATQVQLSQDRASNIGWFFIKSYYDFFISKLDEIHKIYHPHASINHDAFPGTKMINLTLVPQMIMSKMSSLLLIRQKVPMPLRKLF